MTATICGRKQLYNLFIHYNRTHTGHDCRYLGLQGVKGVEGCLVGIPFIKSQNEIVQVIADMGAGRPNVLRPRLRDVGEEPIMSDVCSMALMYSMAFALLLFSTKWGSRTSTRWKLQQTPWQWLETLCASVWESQMHIHRVNNHSDSSRFDLNRSCSCLRRKLAVCWWRDASVCFEEHVRAGIDFPWSCQIWTGLFSCSITCISGRWWWTCGLFSRAQLNPWPVSSWISRGLPPPAPAALRRIP